MINGEIEMQDFRDDDGARFLILKRGLYYRPNSAGYTGIKDEAGRYTEDDARNSSHPNGPRGPRDGMSYVHEDEAPDYSPSCCIHAKADHQQVRIAALEAEATALRAQVQGARDRALVEATAVVERNYHGVRPHCPDEKSPDDAVSHGYGNACINIGKGIGLLRSRHSPAPEGGAGFEDNRRLGNENKGSEGGDVDGGNHPSDAPGEDAVRELVSDGRRWDIAETSGNVFDPDLDYDGWVLSVEVRSDEEADRLRRALAAGGDRP